jgi:CRP/FNR family transcriptional regulator, cyclic AMP receptor protein
LSTQWLPPLENRVIHHNPHFSGAAVDLTVAKEIFRSRGWLSHVPEDFCDSVIALCRWRDVEAGQGVQYAGDGPGSVYGIAVGTVSITTAMSAPDAPVTTIGMPGGWFGYIPMFGGQERAVTVQARSAAVIATIPQASLAVLFDATPGGWRHAGLLPIVSYGHVAANIAGDLMIRDGRRRCVATLLRLANSRFADRQSDDPAEAPVSQSELGSLTNLSRTTISNILGELEAKALVRIGYRSVMLRDTAGLRRIADDG